jgi:hypothetical protein
MKPRFSRDSLAEILMEKNIYEKINPAIFDSFL